MRFNHLNPPFNDVRMRRAVLAAVNQDDYMRSVTGNDPSAYKECKALFPCGTPFGTQIGAPEMKGDLALGKQMLHDAGYAGQKVVIINPTDFPSIGPFGDVTADLLKKLGMNVELQDIDWGTVVQRRASKNPIDQGGWSIFHTWWPSDSILNPVVSAIIRGQGDRGWFGWFSDPKIESLTTDFLHREGHRRAAEDHRRHPAGGIFPGADHSARAVLYPQRLPCEPQGHAGQPGTVLLERAARIGGDDEWAGRGSLYANPDIVARILAALRQVNRADAPITPDALAPLDHFHGRGVLATREMVAMLQPQGGRTDP